MSDSSNILPKITKIDSKPGSGTSGKDLSKPLKNNRKITIRNNKITLREKEVLQLLSNGDSSKMIAQKLHISETTAITHRKNLIQKLQVKNTAHLIKVAVLSSIIV